MITLFKIWASKNNRSALQYNNFYSSSICWLFYMLFHPRLCTYILKLYYVIKPDLALLTAYHRACIVGACWYILGGQWQVKTITQHINLSFYINAMNFCIIVILLSFAFNLLYTVKIVSYIGNCLVQCIPYLQYLEVYTQMIPWTIKACIQQELHSALRRWKCNVWMNSAIFTSNVTTILLHNFAYVSICKLNQ